MRVRRLSVLALCMVFFATISLFGGCSDAGDVESRPQSPALSEESEKNDSGSGADGESERNSSERDCFFVTFDSNGGTEVPTQSVKRGEKVAQPEKPFKIERINGYDVDYVFDGWFLGETEWDFEKTEVTCDITLVAHWHNEWAPPV